jgi:hypothetical protein
MGAPTTPYPFLTFPPKTHTHTQKKEKKKLKLTCVIPNGNIEFPNTMDSAQKLPITPCGDELKFTMEASSFPTQGV